MSNLIKKIKHRFKRIMQSPKERRHKMVGQMASWQMKRDFQISFLKSRNLKPTDKLLDIGCGTLRGGVPIIQHLNAKNYYGIDVREKVFKEAREELEEEKLTDKIPNLIHFDEFKALTIDQKFDFIWAFSVMFHLADPIMISCLEFVSRHLKQDGSYYANVNLGKREQGKWDEFPVVTHELSFYEEVAGRFGLAIEQIDTLRNLGHISNIKTQDDQMMLRFYLK